MSNLAVIEPHTPRPALTTGARPSPIVPTDMESAYRLANAVVEAGMAPKGMETAGKCMVAIMRGMEVGMTPFMALDKIAIVNGRPTIWGDGAMGLVRGSGLCEYVKEWIEGEGDKRVAYCEAKRRGEPEPIRRKFSVTEAKEAGLWNKSGPWQQFKERMLQMRARAFCLRDGFADVLGGLYIKEEVDDLSATTIRDSVPPVPPTPPKLAIAALVEPPTPTTFTPPTPPASSAQQTTAQIETDVEALINEFSDAAIAARDAASLYEAWDDIVSPWLAELFPPDRAALEHIRDKRLAELGAAE